MSRLSLAFFAILLSETTVSAQPLAPGKLRYLRPTGDGWTTECVFTIAKKKDGWSIASVTERGPLKLTLETSYRAKDALDSSVLRLQNGDKKSTAVAAVVNEGVARVQLPE